MLYNYRLICRVIGGFAVASCFALCGEESWAAVNWNGSVSSAFETAGNWTATIYSPLPSLGPESTPPGFDSSFGIENGDYTVILNNERSGLNGTTKLGAFAIGNNPPAGTTMQVQTLIFNNSASLTGLERSTSTTPAGEYNSQLRHIRVGRGRNAADDDGSDVFAWGIVKQTAGLVDLQMDETTVLSPPSPVPVSPQTNRAEILLSSDKDKTAASIWEVGGTASLFVPDEIRLGDRPTVLQMPGHAIFRVRGSDVGSIHVGPAATAGTAPGRFKVVSRAGMWSVDTPAEYNNRPRYNLGKSISEFVLDAGGVTMIEADDQLVIGGDDAYPAGHPLSGVQTALPPGFLRIKLSEPTTKGTGAYNALTPENNLVLFRADRISIDTTGGFVLTTTEFDEGRFFDPDRDGPSLGVGLTPHRRMWENDDVIADYAGATYTWKIHYAESDLGADDGIINDAVYLDNLSITGTQGDLNGDTFVTEADRTMLLGAIASPPLTFLQLLGGPQHLFDLNADDVINQLDLVTFETFFLPPAGLAGDYNGNDVVDAGDYTVWRNHLGQTFQLDNEGDDVSPGMVTAADFDFWKLHFGESLSGAADWRRAACRSLARSCWPRPASLGLLGVRRRAA